MTGAGVYIYRAVDERGRVRTGRLRAWTDAEAMAQLRSDGLKPVGVSRRGEAQRESRRATLVRPRAIADVARELSVLLEAHIPIGQGLKVIAEHEQNPRLAEMLRDIAMQIEAGSPLTEAINRHRSVFGEVFVETVRAAERTGTLDQAMLHLADMLERQIETQQQLRRALTYPAIVLSVVSVAIAVIVVFVVPRFGATFASQGMDLPVFTKIVQAVGESARAWWWAWLGVILSGVIALASLWRSTSGRLMLERMLLRLPLAGRILRAVNAARFSRVMSLSLGAGVELIDSVEMSGRSTGRRVFRRQCDDMAAALRRGEPMSVAMHSVSELPPFASRMIAAGRDSKELAKACSIVARHYDRESSHLTKNINTLIEPLLTVVMAAVVLLIALSVFLPMWQMVGSAR
ncbi:MAG: type II secretion system F family protein [Planctomycetota bacterium]